MLFRVLFAQAVRARGHECEHVLGVRDIYEHVYIQKQRDGISGWVSCNGMLNRIYRRDVK